jgi:hypothetical protein
MVQYTCKHEYLFIICDFIRRHSIMKKQNKIKFEFEHWSRLLNKFVVTLKINNHWK